MGYINGLSKIENSDIKYTYHTHSGDPNTGGGCYVPKYHQHTSSCYKTVSACSGWTKWSSDGWQTCRTCGYRVYAPDASGGIACGRTTSQLVCTHGNDIIGYILGCRKTEDTIESATIFLN